MISFICVIGTLATLFSAIYPQQFVLLWQGITYQCTLLELVAGFFIGLIFLTIIVKYTFKFIYKIKHFAQIRYEKNQLIAKNKVMQQLVLEKLNNIAPGQNTHNEFKKQAKYLQDDPLYWIASYTFTDPNLEKLASYNLKNTPGEILSLQKQVEHMEEEGNFEGALQALEHYHGFGQDTYWFNYHKILCLIELNKFDQASDTASYLPKSYKTEMKVMIIEQQVKKNINKLENLKWLAQNAPSQSHSLQLAQELIAHSEFDQAFKLLDKEFKNKPTIETATLLINSLSNMAPSGRFARVKELIEANATAPEYITQYMLAKTALDANLFMIGRQHLIELAQTHPKLAFPMLGMLEKLEKHDYKSANEWLERALWIN